MSIPVAEAGVHKTVFAKAPIEHALSVFVEQMEKWWRAIRLPYCRKRPLPGRVPWIWQGPGLIVSSQFPRCR